MPHSLKKHVMHNGVLLIFVAGILLTIGDFTLRAWIHDIQVWKLYVIGIFLYFVALNFLAQSYRFENIAIASIIMEIVNLATYIGVSYWKFGETLSRLEMAGVFFGVIAIICLELG